MTTEQEVLDRVKAAFEPFGVTAVTLGRSGVVGAGAPSRMINVLLPNVTIGRRLFSGMVLVLDLNRSLGFSKFTVTQIGDRENTDSFHPHIYTIGAPFCFGGNYDILERYLERDNLDEFASVLLTSVAAIDVEGGPYRVPSSTLQCSSCESWNTYDNGFLRCERCSHWQCRDCTTEARCDLCRGSHYLCNNCADETPHTTVTIVGRDEPLTICDSCLNRYILHSDSPICPNCLRLTRTIHECSNCGQVKCGNCSNYYNCESPFHHHPEDVERYIQSRLTGNPHEMYRHHVNGRVCGRCIARLTESARDYHEHAYYVCMTHSHHQMKRCSNDECKFRWLPLDYFHKNGNSHRSECKFCRNERRRQVLLLREQRRQNEQQTIEDRRQPGPAIADPAQPAASENTREELERAERTAEALNYTIRSPRPRQFDESLAAIFDTSARREDVEDIPY